GGDGDGCQTRAGLTKAQTVVGVEPEQSGTDDRAADGGAELVALILGKRGRGQIEGPGVQAVVAQEFECRAVKRITAALSHYVDLSTGGSAIFRRKYTGLYLELGDGVNRWLVTQAAVVRINIDRAIQQECGVIGSSARHAEAADQALAE